MFKTAMFGIRGVAPILQHSARLADPLSEAAKSLKEVTSRKKKTDADHVEIARREWLGGLVVDAEGAVCISSPMIEAMLVGAARSQRLGKEAERSIMVEADSPLKYDGWRAGAFDTDAGWLDRARFVLTVSARNPGSGTRIMRTRPIFRKWSASVEVSFDDSGFNEKQVADLMVYAGAKIGLGDWRPRYGRFEVVGAK